MIYKCTISKDDSYEWDGAYYLPERMHSFGVIYIDLNENDRYLITFGGTREAYRARKQAWEYQQMSTIYALYINKKYQHLARLDKRWRNVTDEESDEYGIWYELNCKLPRKGNFHAIYDGDVDSDDIHLLSYNGDHYILSRDHIAQILKTQDFVTVCPWTDAGKGAYGRRPQGGVIRQLPGRYHPKSISHMHGAQNKLDPDILNFVQSTVDQVMGMIQIIVSVIHILYVCFIFAHNLIYRWRSK